MPFPAGQPSRLAWPPGLTGLLLPAISGCTVEDRPATVTVAGGEPGGFYLEFAGLLADSLQRHGGADKASALTTGGSLDNLELLLSGKATFAVALSDSAAQRVAAGDATAVGISAVGKVYENYVHCVVRQEAASGTLPGWPAGPWLLASRVGNFADHTPPDRGFGADLRGRRRWPRSPPGTVTVLNLGLNEGLAALQNGSVDALFWSGGVPTAAIAAAHNDAGLGLLDLSPLLPALRAKHGAVLRPGPHPGGRLPGHPGGLDRGRGKPPPVPGRRGCPDGEKDR